MRKNYLSPTAKVMSLNVTHNICDVVPINASSLPTQEELVK